MPEMLQLGLDDAAPRGNPGYQLDVGAVISQTFSVTVSNLPSFVLVGLLAYSPALVLHVIAALAASSNFTYPLVLIANLSKSLLALVLTGALTFGVMRQLRGEKASIGETVQAGLESLGRVFLVSLLVGLLTLGGFLLCIVPGVIVLCMNWVAVPVAVIERPGIRASLSRSQELTAGTRMAVFAVVLVIGMVTGVAAMVTTVGLTAAAAALTGTKDLNGVDFAVTQLVQTLVLLPFECLQATSAAVGYHDLRVHREGADVADLVRVFE